MSYSSFENAMIEVRVTTAAGIVPIAGAKVTMHYTHLPRLYGESREQVTDADGKTGAFILPIRRAEIGGKQVDLPRRAVCDVEIEADGYVSLYARGIQLFPGVTVVSSFDLLACAKSGEAGA